MADGEVLIGGWDRKAFGHTIVGISRREVADGNVLHGIQAVACAVAALASATLTIVGATTAGDVDGANVDTASCTTALSISNRNGIGGASSWADRYAARL